MHIKRLLAVSLSAAMIVTSSFSSLAATTNMDDLITNEAVAEASQDASDEASAGASTEEGSGEASTKDPSEGSSEKVTDPADEASTEDSTEKEKTDPATEASTEGSSEDAADAASSEASEDAADAASSEASEPEIEIDEEALTGEASSCFTVDEEGVLQLVPTATIKADVVIPAACKVIPKGIFNDDDTKNWRHITFDPGSELVEIEAGAFDGSNITSIKLPDSITSIGKEAFKGADCLDTVTGGRNVTVIGDSAFKNTKLNSFTFNSGLTSIGHAAFEKCKFYSVDLSGITGDISIGRGCFKDNDTLHDVKLPTKLSAIPERLFYNCPALVDVFIGDENSLVTTVGAEAFCDCSKIAKIVFPRSVKAIENRAMDGCSGLIQITIKNEEPSADDFSIAEEAFPKKAEVVIKGYGGKVKDYAGIRGYKYEPLRTYDIDFNTKDFKDKATVSLNVNMKAEKHDTVKITIAPKTGYILESLRVEEKASSQKIDWKLEDITDKAQIFKFEMPGEDVHIDVNMKKADDVSIKDVQVSIEEVGEEGKQKIEKPYLKEDKKTLVFDVVGEQGKLVLKEKEVPINEWMWNYSSSNTKVVEVTKTGIVRAVAVGTATINITFKGNGSKRIALNAKVTNGSNIKNLELELPDKKVAKKLGIKLDSEEKYPKAAVGDSEVEILQFTKAHVDSETVKFDVSVDTFSDDDPPKNLIVTTKWTSVDSKVATLATKSSTNNKNTVTIKKGATGESLITVAVYNKENGKDVLADSKSFIVRVVDSTPRLANNEITVNSLSTVGTKLNLVNVYGYSIKEPTTSSELRLGTIKKDKKGMEVFTDSTTLMISYETDGIYIKKDPTQHPFAKTYSGTSQLYVRGIIKETNLSFTLPIKKVTVTNKAYSPTVKTSGKINLFYTQASDMSGSVTVTQSLKDVKVVDQLLVSTANYKKYGIKLPASYDDPFRDNFDITHDDKDNKKFIVTRSNEAIQKNSKGKAVTSGYLYIMYEGMADWVAKSVSISTYDTAPSLVLKKTSVTANVNAQNQSYELRIVDKKTKKKELALDEAGNELKSLTLAASTTEDLFKPLDKEEAIEDGFITLGVDGYPEKGKAVINVQLEKWSRPIAFTFNLKTTGSLPTAKVSAATVTLNKAYASQGTAVTIKHNQDAQEVHIEDVSHITCTTKGKLAADGAKLLEKMKASISEKDVIPVNLPDEEIAAGTYTFSVKPMVQYGDRTPQQVKAVTFKVVVVNKHPGIKLKSSTLTMNTDYAGREEVSTTYSVVNLPTGVQGEVEDAGNLVSKLVPGKNTPEATDILESLTVTADKKVTAVLSEDYRRVYAGKTLSYTVKGLKVSAGSDEPEIIPFSVKIKIRSAKPSVKWKSSGKLNPVDDTSKVVYTASVSNVVSKIEFVEFKEIDGRDDFVDPAKSHFVVEADPSNSNKIIVKADSTNVVDNNKKYKIRVYYIFSKGDENQKKQHVDFTIVPKQSIPKVKTNAKPVTVYAGQATRSFDIVITKADKKKYSENVDIIGVKLADNTPAALKKAFGKPVFTPATPEQLAKNPGMVGTATVTLVSPSAIVMEKSYTLNLETEYRNQAKKSTGNKFSVKVTVKK
ncbi:MAG: leucine-rich repeat domain-containing protein [Butyrivibrio sp.]|nr:leucine-rich repeat domain-containing protein [Butyrivibrio sp.]